MYMPTTLRSGFIRAVENRMTPVGEVFNTVSEQAVTLKGYAETVYRWFGKDLVFRSSRSTNGFTPRAGEANGASEAAEIGESQDF
jgi:hypothetical protein